ncbi:hypothetical protein L210DRAFT_215342 [Boletus edulis BED1]|uniref:Uncharacterized protein n=1 Tax=Boletus edulis BED1 TaxID=1328754 RepID=A0AAD4BSA5_BOLED|nr:hypothetical protein L210DRAFT_215342 [Boletus edulis BED1]
MHPFLHFARKLARLALPYYFPLVCLFKHGNQSAGLPFMSFTFKAFLRRLHGLTIDQTRARRHHLDTFTRSLRQWPALPIYTTA